jgi:hypothetical protein
MLSEPTIIKNELPNIEFVDYRKITDEASRLRDLSND